MVLAQRGDGDSRGLDRSTRLNPSPLDDLVAARAFADGLTQKEIVLMLVARSPTVRQIDQ
ncbi:MAG TPA: hypothetical protein V6C46_06575 [Coleofasciculaceae cyanobacterium]